MTKKEFVSLNEEVLRAILFHTNIEEKYSVTLKLNVYLLYTIVTGQQKYYQITTINTVEQLYPRVKIDLKTPILVLNYIYKTKYLNRLIDNVKKIETESTLSLVDVLGLVSDIYSVVPQFFENTKLGSKDKYYPQLIKLIQHYFETLWEKLYV